MPTHGDGAAAARKARVAGKALQVTCRGTQKLPQAAPRARRVGTGRWVTSLPAGRCWSRPI